METNGHSLKNGTNTNHSDEADSNIFTSIFGKDKTTKIDEKINKNDKKTEVIELIPKALSMPTMNEYYDVTNEKRGIALIFNHMNFTNMSKRSGTNKDRDRIEKVLKSFDFDVRVYNDLTQIEIEAILYRTSKEDHSKNDCFLTVIMSHGDEGIIYARDTQYPVQNLWTSFLGDKCKSLIGKPKLFFIQACRGDKLDSGVILKAEGFDRVDSSPEEQIYFNIPQMADLLVMYSTFEGHYSWRNPANGSWFIQGICSEFMDNGKTRDILTLLTGVCRRVAYEYQSNVPDNQLMDCMKQMPCIVSMLTKTLHFFRKDIHNIKID